MAVYDITFGVIERGSGAYGGSGSCSMKWVDGVHGKYDPATRTYSYDKLDVDFAGYKSAVMCFTSASQEAQLGLVKGLEKNGFIKLGGVRSAHGKYNCNLWLLEPRAGKDDQYNKGDAYHFYPNPEVFVGAPGCGGAADNSKQLKDLQKQLEKAQTDLAESQAAEEVAATKLEHANALILQLKQAAAERRLLKRTQRTTSLTGNKKEAGSNALLRSGVRKTKGVRMGGRNAL